MHVYLVANKDCANKKPADKIGKTCSDSLSIVPTTKQIRKHDDFFSSNQVSAGKYFDVGSGEVWVKIFAKDAEEAAKLFGQYLRCAGRLKSYAEESKPCKIEVTTMEFQAHFNAWFTLKSTESLNVQGTVILECCFIKKVYMLQSHII